MANLAFKHPAVNSVVHSQAMISLERASHIVGAPSPVDSLRYVDCDPRAMRSHVAQMADSYRPYTQASAHFREGQQHAMENWSGQAAMSFDRTATNVAEAYDRSIGLLQASVQAGEHIAGELDELAGQAAGRSAPVAQAAQQSSEIVITLGHEADLRDTTAVAQACADVLAVVNTSVQQIPELTHYLDGLT